MGDSTTSTTSTTSNIDVALQILGDMYATGSTVIDTIRTAIANNQDITQQQMNAIVSQRNAALSQLQTISNS